MVGQGSRRRRRGAGRRRGRGRCVTRRRQGGIRCRAGSHMTGRAISGSLFPCSGPKAASYLFIASAKDVVYRIGIRIMVDLYPLKE